MKNRGQGRRRVRGEAAGRARAGLFEADLSGLIDHAGDFLIGRREYKDGLELYRAAALRFPDVAVFHQGVACCAGHQGLHSEAIAASRRALALEPGNQRFMNDLGWSLFEAGQLSEAEETLSRAVAMDPNDQLAAENLRFCKTQLAATGVTGATPDPYQPSPSQVRRSSPSGRARKPKRDR